MALLSNGTPFPTMTLATVGGGTESLPGDLAGSYGVVLAFRGAWCPYCNAQLASFQRATDRLAEVGVAVSALSVDDEETTAALVVKHHLAFPVAHGVDPAAFAAATGAFVNPQPAYVQSTGFVLSPDGDVLTAVYSGGAIGRLVPEDVIVLVGHLRSQG